MNMAQPARRGIFAFSDAKAKESRLQQASSTRPTAAKGGLDLLYHVQLGDTLESATASSCKRILAAAADGCVVLVDTTDGSMIRRSDTMGEDPPNVIAWSSDSAWLVCCSDDGIARVISADKGTVVLEHVVAKDPDHGKRQRCVPSDHAIFIDATSFAAAAGSLIHVCEVPGGKLSHTLSTDAPVHALCRSPPSLAVHWAYAAAFKGGVVLVSLSGDRISHLSSCGHLHSLAVTDQWLAACTLEGTIELWDVAKRATTMRPSEAEKTVRPFCGSDGVALDWSADGGGLAMSGKRVAVIDFTGDSPPHPYRSAEFAAAAYHGRPGEPDPVPRVCMGSGARLVAWAPHRDQGASTMLATAIKDGTVQIWKPRGLPLRKGGVGDPAKPQQMKPQFYTYMKADAVHPVGEAREPCALVWLAEDIVAVCYDVGDIVAWRIAPAV